MKKLARCLLPCLLAAAMLLPCLPAAAVENNAATDWMSEALYGIDGPSPAVNIPPINPSTWAEDVYDFDVKAAVDIAEQAGAGYMLIGSTQIDGYLIAPNPVYDEITGHQPGEKCSTRDFIEEYYQELSKRGMKLMLYFTGDGPGRDAADSVKMGWDGTANETFRKNWFSVVEYWSKKYGDKIAGWWVDGSYTWIGYDSPEILQGFADAIKAGNPNAVVCFNEGLNEDSWNPRWGVSDFIAGENYGLYPEPEGRWHENIQWHRYMPLYEYNGAGCAYSVPELVEYMKKVKAAGGCVTFAVGSSGERVMPFDPVQLDVLKALKKALRDGEDPVMSFDGSQKIQAGQCTEMMHVGEGEAMPSMPRAAITPILCSTGAEGGGIRWQVPKDPENVFVTTESYAPGANFEMWAKYSSVSIPEGAKYLAISVKEPEEKRFAEFEHRLEVRLDERIGGQVIATADNVGYVDSFWFTSEPATETPVEGYTLLNIPVEVSAGVRDIYLANVLKDAQSYAANQQIKAIYASSIPQGQFSFLINASDNNSVTLGNLDDGDTIGYSNVDFGETGAVQFTARLAVDAAYANQKMELYIDAPNTTEGKLVGTHSVQATDGWEAFTVQSSPIEEVTGVHDFYIVCRGGQGVGNFDWFRLSDSVSAPDYSEEAQKLYDLGLYKGISEDTFDPDLDSALDRQTGVVMLLRLFDVEEEALALTDAEADQILSKFTDKDSIALWAKPHVAYAVENGIVMGVAEDRFGPSEPLLGKAYCTLVLRNLGYTVSGDEYNEAAYILAQKGGLTEAEAKVLNDRELLKNEMVGISYYSLFATAADGTTPMDALAGEVTPGGDTTVSLEGAAAITDKIAAIEFDSKIEHPLDIPRAYSEAGGYVGNLDGLTWVCYEDVDFGSEGADLFAAEVGCDPAFAKQFLEVRLDSPDAAPAATLTIAATDGWTDFKTQVTAMTKTTGVHDVYIYGNGGSGICSLHTIQFLNSEGVGGDIVETDPQEENEPQEEVTQPEEPETVTGPTKPATEKIVAIEFDSKVDHPLDIPRIYNEDGGYVGNIEGLTWICYENVDFGSEGVTKFVAEVGCDPEFAEQFLEVRLDSPDAAPVATLTIEATDGWTDFEAQETEMTKTTGVHDVYIYGNGGSGICSLHSIQFFK